VEFGEKLEIIGSGAFCHCPIKSIKIPTLRTIKNGAFSDCRQLAEAEFGGKLEIIGYGAFRGCLSLRRIAIPLKDDMIEDDPIHYRCTQFDRCTNLARVDLVGGRGIKNTISSLLLQSWKDDMNTDIGFINQLIPHIITQERADAIQDWIRTVISRMDQYKAEHSRLLKEDMTLLELAIWKAKLDDFMAPSLEVQPTKKAKLDVDEIRRELRITSGASIIIKNVLPFLSLIEYDCR